MILGGRRLDLDPVRPDPEIHNVDGAIIQRFSTEVCGVRVTNFVKTLMGEWVLFATDDRRTEDKDNVKMDIIRRLYYN